MINDKKGAISRAKSGEIIKVDLGCGDRVRPPDVVGVDIIDYANVDIVGDVFAVVDLLPDNSVSEIYSSHFFEHINDVYGLLEKIVRILTEEGFIKVTVPHFSNPFFYSDPTHKSFFGLYTMGYYCRGRVFRRTLPNYRNQLPLMIVSTRLVFKSYRPNYVRHALKKVFENIINSSNFVREFYEENLCWLVPCYEIVYIIGKAGESEFDER
jgi:hypothetical protein